MINNFMNLFDLPTEIRILIYSFDSTYKDLYNLVIKDIFKLPKYETYYSEYHCYLFSTSPYRGIYIYTHIESDNYKKAFKKALKRSIKN